MYDTEEKVFAEVNFFINTLSENLRKCISKKFCDFISENMDKEYYNQIIQNSKDFNYSEKAEIIIGIIYRDFLSGEQKEFLIQKDKEEVDKYKKLKEKKDKEMIENLFKNKQEIKIEENVKKNEKNVSAEMIDNSNIINTKESNSTDLAVLNIPWYKKIFNKFIDFIFGRKK